MSTSNDQSTIELTQQQQQQQFQERGRSRSREDKSITTTTIDDLNDISLMGFKTGSSKQNSPEKVKTKQ
ncbi:uncharacterized protein KGF55_003090 [Candida pseudojiufengensis]|uniref:uncharacterized protein n=1 Tax=Candida pseudojiufengensis TaxID=497109 RepID=UPI002224DD17|nr:uncharacterized protein KGF55_003090 [Candida pseudojiufengensis]KAI5963298.1 hypothetical protein KGF55_003090 [Candida pseudojiufengensis]